MTELGFSEHLRVATDNLISQRHEQGAVERQKYSDAVYKRLQGESQVERAGMTIGDVLAEVPEVGSGVLDYVFANPTRQAIKGAAELFGELDYEKPQEQWTTREYMIHDMNEQIARSDQWMDSTRREVEQELGMGASVPWTIMTQGLQTGFSILQTIYGSRLLGPQMAGTVGKIANMAKIGALKYATTPGDHKTRGTAAAQYAIFAATPFLTGPLAGELSARLGVEASSKAASVLAVSLDAAANHALSHGLGMYKEAEAQAQQLAKDDGKDWKNMSAMQRFGYRAQTMAPIAFTDLYFSLNTRASTPLWKVKADLQKNPIAAAMLEGVDTSKGGERAFLKAMRGDYDKKSDVQAKAEMTTEMARAAGMTLNQRLGAVFSDIAKAGTPKTPEEARVAMAMMRRLGLDVAQSQKAMFLDDAKQDELGLTEKQKYVAEILAPDEFSSLVEKQTNHKRAIDELEVYEAENKQVYEILSRGGRPSTEGLLDLAAVTEAAKLINADAGEVAARLNVPISDLATSEVARRLASAKEIGVPYTKDDAIADTEKVLKEIGYDSKEITAWKDELATERIIDGEPTGRKDKLDVLLRDKEATAEYQTLYYNKLSELKALGLDPDMKAVLVEAKNELLQGAEKEDRKRINQWYRSELENIKAPDETIVQQAVRERREAEDFAARADAEYARIDAEARSSDVELSPNEIVKDVASRLGEDQPKKAVDEWVKASSVAEDGKPSELQKKIEAGKQKQKVQSVYLDSLEREPDEAGKPTLTRDERIKFVAESMKVTEAEARKAIDELEPAKEVKTPEERDYAKTWTEAEETRAKSARSMQLYLELTAPKDGEGKGGGLFSSLSGAKDVQRVSAVVAERMVADGYKITAEEVARTIREQMPWLDTNVSAELKELNKIASVEIKAESEADKALQAAVQARMESGATEKVASAISKQYPSASRDIKMRLVSEIMGRDGMTADKDVLERYFPSEKAETTQAKAEKSIGGVTSTEYAKQLYDRTEAALRQTDDELTVEEIGKRALRNVGLLSLSKEEKKNLNNQLVGIMIDKGFLAEMNASKNALPEDTTVKVKAEPTKVEPAQKQAVEPTKEEAPKPDNTKTVDEVTKTSMEQTEKAPSMASISAELEAKGFVGTRAARMAEARAIKEAAEARQEALAKEPIDISNPPEKGVYVPEGSRLGVSVEIAKIDGNAAVLKDGSRVSASRIFNLTSKTVTKSSNETKKLNSMSDEKAILVDKLASWKRGRQLNQLQRDMMRDEAFRKSVWQDVRDRTEQAIKDRAESIKKELGDSLNKGSFSVAMDNEYRGLSKDIGPHIEALRELGIIHKNVTGQEVVDQVLTSIFSKEYISGQSKEGRLQRKAAQAISEDAWWENVTKPHGSTTALRIFSDDMEREQLFTAKNLAGEAKILRESIKDRKSFSQYMAGLRERAKTNKASETVLNEVLKLAIDYSVEGDKTGRYAKGLSVGGKIGKDAVELLLGDNPSGIRVLDAAPDKVAKDTIATFEKGEIEIYADRITSMDQVFRVAIDEIKHKGVQVLGREGKGSWLDRIMKGYPESRWMGKLEDTLRKYTNWDGKTDPKNYFDSLMKSDYGGKEMDDRYRVFEEMIVHMESRMPTAFRKVVSDMKMRLNQLFPGITLSDKDIQAQLFKALKAGVNGEVVGDAGARQAKGETPTERNSSFYATAVKKYGSISKAIAARDAAGYKGTWMRFVSEESTKRAVSPEKESERVSSILSKDLMTHKPLSTSAMDKNPILRNARRIMNAATGAGENISTALARMGSAISKRAVEDFSAVISESSRINLKASAISRSNRRLTQQARLSEIDNNLGRDASGEKIRGTRAMRVMLGAYVRMGQLDELLRVYDTTSGDIVRKTSAVNDAIEGIADRTGTSARHLKQMAYAFMGKKVESDGKSSLVYDPRDAKEFTTDEAGSLRSYKLRLSDVVRIGRGTSAIERQWLDREFGRIMRELGPELKASYDAQNEKPLELLGGFYAPLMRDFRPLTAEQRKEMGLKGDENPQFLSEDYRESIVALDTGDTSAVKARTFSDAPIKWVGADRLLQKHVSDVARYVSGNRTWDSWKAALQDNENDIVKRFGEAYYKNLISNIEKQEGVIDTSNEQMQKFANWALGRATKVILQQPVTWAKQVGSFVNFAVPFDGQAISYAAATRGTAKGQEIIKKMRSMSYAARWRLENARVETDYLGGSSQWRERYKTISGTKSMFGNIATTGRLSDSLSKITSRVDAWTINGGMLAAYDYVRRTTNLRGDALMKEAVKQFEIALHTTQVSGETAFMSPLRLSRDPIARMFSYMSGATSAAYNHAATDFHNWANDKSAKNTAQLVKSVSAIVAQAAVVSMIGYTMATGKEQDVEDLAFRYTQDLMGMTIGGGYTGPMLLSLVAKARGDTERAGKLVFRNRELPSMRVFETFNDLAQAIVGGNAQAAARSMEDVGNIAAGLNTTYWTRLLRANQ